MRNNVLSRDADMLILLPLDGARMAAFSVYAKLSLLCSGPVLIFNRKTSVWYQSSHFTLNKKEAYFPKLFLYWRLIYIQDIYPI